MTYGYNNRVGVVDLTTGRVEIERPGEVFFKTYLGGSAVGAYYLLKKMPPKSDPLGPENVIVFAPSILTGAPISGLSRFNVTAKSPLTNTIGDAQCGGYWGVQLKYAGFDALVITGSSPKPVYIWVSDGVIEIKDAEHLEKLFPEELEKKLKDAYENKKIQIVQNGPAGRNLVRFANIGNSLHHYAGRTGMGAVMGSKKLVAIAAWGKRSYSYYDEAKVREMSKKAAAVMKESTGMQYFSKRGTSSLVETMQGLGGLPTYNMKYGNFEGYKGIESSAMHETIFKRSSTCYACLVRCKRVVGSEEPYINEGYGGPEYETIGMLGSNLGIGDIKIVAKANELCNAYGMDTISTGGMIAFAMECFENEIIGLQDTGGIELKFGNAEAVLEVIKMIGECRGIGKILGEGFSTAIEKYGKESEKYAIHVKGSAIPAHMPQIKKTQALAYAVNTYGADHMSCEHDGMLAACNFDCNSLGILNSRDWETLDLEKVRYVAYSQLYYSLLDTLELCAFCFAPGMLFNYRDLEEITTAVSGFPGNLWFLMKAGERRLNMLKAFNYREGIEVNLDELPERIFQPLEKGVQKGVSVNRSDLKQALKDYYAITGWDYKTGRPTRGKLLELGLSWLEETI